MGRPPFKSDGSFTFVVYQHVHSPPPAIESLTGTIPAPVKEIIQKCLEKKPESRFQTPEELLSALVRARGGVRPTAKPGAALPPEPAPSDWAWRARTVALVLVMLVGAACAMFAVLRRPSSPPPPPVANDHAEVTLLLGLGEFQEAAKLAESRWGPESKEVRSVATRQADTARQEFDVKARDALRARDWRAAAQALEKARIGALPDRVRELDAALQLSNDLLKARQLEEGQNHADALKIYRQYSEKVPSLRDYLRERITRCQMAIDHDSRK